jgi:DNA-binding GntR family transcriptional regulator
LLREALECEAARIYAGGPVRRAAHLDALAAAADRSERTHSLMDLWQAEFAFHRALVGLVGSAPFAEAYEKIMQRKLFVSAQLFLSGEAFVGGNHVALLAALRAADADRAERLVREHLRSKKERLFEPLTP